MGSREDFERLVSPLNCTRAETGAYCSPYVQLQWLTWQSSTERAARICDQFRSTDPTAASAARQIREGNV